MARGALVLFALAGALGACRAAPHAPQDTSLVADAAPQNHEPPTESSLDDSGATTMPSWPSRPSDAPDTGVILLPNYTGRLDAPSVARSDALSDAMRTANLRECAGLHGPTGRFDADTTVDAAGRITHMEVDQGFLGSPRGKCMIDRLSKIQLPPAVTAGGFHTVIPLVFPPK